jgi:DNA ligase-1
MRFADLVAAYQRLEATTKRLERRAILVEVMRAAPLAELPEILYLSQGLLRPEYEGVELGVADSLLRRAIASATGATDEAIEQKYRENGDLGSTAESLRAAAGAPLASEATVGEVYTEFSALAAESGDGSQEAKIRRLAGLLARASPVEAKYIARFALGQLRLGIREMSILDALGEAFGPGTKESKARIEASFNLCSDLGVVAQRLAEEGVPGLAQVHLTVGRPVRPMLAERSPDLADVLTRMEGRAALEYKYDGIRVQAHLPAEGEPRLFSRRLENISDQFPELLRELPRALKRRPAIVEGECVSVDTDTDEMRPFQEVSRRRGRKYDLPRMEAEVPVRLFLFDVLLDGATPTMALDFPERRRRLAEMVQDTDRVRVATQREVTDVPGAQAFFDQAIIDGCEGVMAKSLAPGSAYRAGARGFWWIKYKREYSHALADSIDGVVVGGFYGRGRRAGKFGALLMASYDPQQDRFESFCKVGSGFDDALLTELPRRLAPYVVDHRPEEVETGLVPDVWMRPGLVLELRGAELSLSPTHRAAFGAIRPGAGFALRFPRFTGRFREDKAATQATTGRELLSLYRSQVRRSEGPTGPR